MDNPTLSPAQIWDRVFERVQRTVNVADALAGDAGRPAHHH